ncbi:MAG TPA: hypothetical protein VFW73_12470 [Lacipirellulaceae bacterium]|nr:hypothetical protein [Lacipirellulaceae bacterium]
MARQLAIWRRNWLLYMAMAALAAMSATNAPLVGAKAADLAEQAHSLRKVPADAAFYSASLRLREQWHAFKSSKAYAKLMEIPLVQFAKMQVEFQWQQSEQPAVAKFRGYVQSPAGQDGVAVLKEMFSDECFVYGGRDIVESLKLFTEFNSLRSTVQLEAMAKGKTPEEISINRGLEILDRHSSTFKLPTIVLGSRIKDKARAQRELDEVHSLIRNALDENQPNIAAHLQREQIAGHPFLTLRLDGSMLPWDQVREAAKSLDDEQFAKLKTFIMKHKLTVALGVTDEFVLLSISESTDHLEKLGQGAVIADAVPLKRLAKHADQRVVGIQYVSKAIQAFNSPQRSLDNLAVMAEQALESLKVSGEHRKQIADDIRSLNVSKYMPQPGNTSGICFLTSRGYESFYYNDGHRPMMDSSKPLTILSHVGGSPMFLFASRSKQNIKDYEQTVDWLKKTTLHVEQIAEEKSDPDHWAKYQELRKRIVGLLKRIDQANRTDLYPALADGQGAFIFDVSAKSKQWFDKMPESPTPLPMLEMAFVAGVSNADLLRQGVTAYIDVARDAYKMVRELNPNKMPELRMPMAKVSNLLGGGKLYSYPLPKKWGVDPQVAVNAGLTDKFVAVSLMPKTTERLLTETAPDFDTSLQLGRPAAMVVHVEFAKFIDALRPWIDYGVDVATGKLKVHKEGNAEEGDQQPTPEQSQKMMMLGAVVPQIQQFLDVATVFRSVTSVTYEEGGQWVTHSETHIQDLK